MITCNIQLFDLLSWLFDLEDFSLIRILRCKSVTVRKKKKKNRKGEIRFHKRKII